MTPTTFDNVTAGMLADAIGALDVEAKAIKTRLDAAKAEFKSRKLDSAAGDRFTITRSDAVRWTLNAKGLKDEMGENWCNARSRTASVTSLRVAAIPAALGA